MSRDRELQNDRRMSDVEALMWNLEKDPHLGSSIANITILDVVPDLVRLRTRLEGALASVPRLRQRVVPALGRLAPPEWREDPDFDLDYHIRALALPAPGTMRQLLDLASDLVSKPFDRTRPLWEFTVVVGLEGERAAMIQKLHHAITDGEGGIRMSEQFIDLARDAVEPIAPGRPVPPSIDQSLVETTVDTLTHQLRRGLGIGRRTVEGGLGLVSDPRRLVPLAEDVAELGRSALRQLVVTDPSRSPLWRQRSLRRHIEVIKLPFDDVKAAAGALGGSFNDLFVAAAAGGAAAYHEAAGTPVEELRMAMPVSTRTSGSSGGNAFTPTRILLPVGVADRQERFDAIRAALAATKQERAVSLMSGVAGIANLLPTSVSVRMARQQVETVDFTTSNVRGAPFPLFIAGARILANYPIGPTGGTAWNLTVMTSSGFLDMGLHVDLGAVPDPGTLRDAIEQEFNDLVALASPPRRRAPSKAARKKPRSAPKAATGG